MRNIVYSFILIFLYAAKAGATANVIKLESNVKATSAFYNSLPRYEKEQAVKEITSKFREIDLVHFESNNAVTPAAYSHESLFVKERDGTKIAFIHRRADAFFAKTFRYDTSTGTFKYLEEDGDSGELIVRTDNSFATVFQFKEENPSLKKKSIWYVTISSIGIAVKIEYFKDGGPEIAEEILFSEDRNDILAMLFPNHDPTKNKNLKIERRGFYIDAHKSDVMLKDANAPEKAHPTVLKTKSDIIRNSFRITEFEINTPAKLGAVSFIFGRTTFDPRAYLFESGEVIDNCYTFIDPKSADFFLSPYSGSLELVSKCENDLSKRQFLLQVSMSGVGAEIRFISFSQGNDSKKSVLYSLHTSIKY